MKTFHWGHGIALFLVLFVATLIGLLVHSMNSDHTLVVEDYYQQDLAYQKEYDKRQNALGQHLVDVHSWPDSQLVVVHFIDAKQPHGSIKLYRPDNKLQDIEVPVSDTIVSIPTQALLPGNWQIIIDWEDQDRGYFHKDRLII